MTPTKPPKSTPRASPRIACYGTAFLADAALDAKLLIPEVAADARQFSSPALGRLVFDRLRASAYRRTGDDGKRSKPLCQTKPPERNGRTQRRLAILNGLATLAKHAQLGQTRMMLRVEYRMQR
jgi:hypothetical protein